MMCTPLRLDNSMVIERTSHRAQLPLDPLNREDQPRPWPWGVVLVTKKGACRSAEEKLEIVLTYLVGNLALANHRLKREACPGETQGVGGRHAGQAPRTPGHADCELVGRSRSK